MKDLDVQLVQDALHPWSNAYMHINSCMYRWPGPARSGGCTSVDGKKNVDAILYRSSTVKRGGSWMLSPLDRRAQCVHYRRRAPAKVVEVSSRFPAIPMPAKLQMIRGPSASPWTWTGAVCFTAADNLPPDQNKAHYSVKGNIGNSILSFPDRSAGCKACIAFVKVCILALLTPQPYNLQPYNL